MRKSEESAPSAETAGLDQHLELPDWSGMDDSSARVDVDTAFRLCDEYILWFEEYAKKWEFQREEKCVVEFVL